MKSLGVSTRFTYAEGASQVEDELVARRSLGRHGVWEQTGVRRQRAAAVDVKVADWDEKKLVWQTL